MYEQMDMFDALGIVMQEEVKPAVHDSFNELPCGRCLCEKCCNNVDCLRSVPGEMQEPCFNCDECYNYNHYGVKRKKYECDKFIITEADAERARSRLKVVK